MSERLFWVNAWCSALTVFALSLLSLQHLLLWRQGLLKELHVELILLLHLPLFTQTHLIAHITLEAETKCHHRISDAGSAGKILKQLWVSDDSTSYTLRGCQHSLVLLWRCQQCVYKYRVTLLHQRSIDYTFKRWKFLTVAWVGFDTQEQHPSSRTNA